MTYWSSLLPSLSYSSLPHKTPGNTWSGFPSPSLFFAVSGHLGRTVDTRFGDQLTRGCLVAAGLVQLVSVVPFRVGPSDREAFRSS